MHNRPAGFPATRSVFEQLSKCEPREGSRDLVPRLHVARGLAVRVVRRNHAVRAERTTTLAVAVAIAEVTNFTRKLLLLNDVLPLRVVLVLHEVDDGVDVLVVNVPLGQDELFLDDGMIVLNRTNVTSFVLVDDQGVGLDQTL